MGDVLLLCISGQGHSRKTMSSSENKGSSRAADDMLAIIKDQIDIVQKSTTELCRANELLSAEIARALLSGSATSPAPQQRDSTEVPRQHEIPGNKPSEQRMGHEMDQSERVKNLAQQLLDFASNG